MTDQPEQQRIFKFTLPQYGDFFADPLVIRRLLMQHSGSKIWKWVNRCHEIRKLYTATLNAKPEGVTEEESEVMAAMLAELTDLEGKIAEATFQAFSLPRLDPKDGSGMVEIEALKLCAEFAGWLEKKDVRPGA